jgi:hypothetical protein
MSNIIKIWNNKSIRWREKDQYGSLTDMAHATGKSVGHWLANKTTNQYLQALEESIGIPVDQIIQVNESGGTNEERGTWAHRRACIRFAQWCSPELAVQVDGWVEELLTKGTVSIKQMTLAEQLLASVQLTVDLERNMALQQQHLLKHDERLDKIEDRFSRVDAELKALPACTEVVPEKSTRSAINELIRSYSYRTGEEYRYLWTNLYKEYRYRHHVDLVTRAKNQKLNVLSYAEQVGAIDKLYATALLLYGDML